MDRTSSDPTLKITGLALMIAVANLALAADPQMLLSSKDVKWGPAPALLPKGAMMAVLAGDPGASGPVAVRLKMPAGYKIPAHWHPSDEQVTVLSGTLSLGMGDKLDRTRGQTLMAGGYAVAPAHMNHYAWTKTGATIQINLLGPFQLTYVNAADDPSQSPTK